FRTPTCRRSPRFRSRKVVDVLAVPTPGVTAPAGMADAAVRARATPEAAKTTLRVRFMIRVSPSYRAGLLVTVGTALLLFEDRMTASKVLVRVASLRGRPRPRLGRRARRCDGVRPPQTPSDSSHSMA